MPFSLLLGLLFYVLNFRATQCLRFNTVFQRVSHTESLKALLVKACGLSHGS